MKKEEAENPFKKIESKEPAPERIKEKVMASVNFSNMLVDITELFTSNMANTIGGLFKVKTEEDSGETGPDANNKDT